MSQEILLSILTPSIPSRFEMMKALSDNILGQIGDLPVQHIILSDNKKMSIGAKREALLQISNSRYLCYLDDDDYAFPYYVKELVSAIEANPDVDVIVFSQHSVINGKKFSVRFGLEYPVPEQAQIMPDGEFIDIKRPPWIVCAWRSSLAKKYHFDTSQGFNEDWLWIQQLLSEAKTQHRIDAVLHTYRYDEKTSEGDQTILARKLAEEAAQAELEGGSQA